MSKKIDVVICRPGKKAEVITISNELKALQRIVGGYIECFYPFGENDAFICNDEGKLRHLEYSRAITDPRGNLIDVIAGPFIICDASKEHFGSLSPEKIKCYLKIFEFPEDIYISSSGKLMVLPYEPLF